jgi:hypothetical protein
MHLVQYLRNEYSNFLVGHPREGGGPVDLGKNWIPAKNMRD